MTSRCLICGRTCPKGEYHAACAKSLFGSESAPSFTYSTDDLNRLAKNLIFARVSVPGVQAKLSLHLERSAAGADRLTLVGLDGDYILKLPTSTYPELPESEHFAMSLANRCGIATAAFGLVRLASGERAYLTRRMDRERGVKAMEDFCQLTERPTEKKYFGSYEQIGRLIRQHAAFGGVDALRFFEEVLFCYLTGNNDMHLKNFSLLRESDGAWNLSPAYDLVPVQILLPSDVEELALNLNGKKRHLKANDFVCFAESLRLNETQCSRAVSRLARAIDESLEEALSASFLSEGFKSSFRKLLVERLSVFGREDDGRKHAKTRVHGVVKDLKTED